MRGEDSLLTQKYHESCRITPACAGKTYWQARQRWDKPDHPRMRGEDGGNMLNAMVYGGSPPHARGRHRSPTVRKAAAWITPACAGKTTCRRAFTTCRRDHPRMRGEDRSRHVRRGRGRGSPPHARGRQTSRLRIAYGARITPACAGKTLNKRQFMALWKDHPRMRGEDCSRTHLSTTLNGSPPHARGRLGLQVGYGHA